MQDTIFHLSTCDTCRKILREIGADKHGFVLQDIKTQPLTEAQLEVLKEKAGSYEALFSRRAQLYKELNLVAQTLEEKDYRQYLLHHYTFLKRPVAVYQDRIFIGNDRKTVEALKQAISGK